MDGFLYYRVPTSALFQFAQLAINSNAQHPSHHRGSKQTAEVSSSPFLLNKFELRFVVYSSITAALPSSSSPFPLPLVDVICAYCLLHSFVSGEASGVYRLYSGNGELQATVETAHSDTASSVACLPNTDTIVTAARDGNIFLFRQQQDDTHSAASQPLSSPPAAAPWRRVGDIAHRHEVHSLCWCIVRNPYYEPEASQSPPSSSSSARSHLIAIIVGSSSPTLDVYDPVTTRLLHQLPGHSAKVSAIAVLPPAVSSASSMSPQSSQSQTVGSRVVSCSWDGDCRLWDLERLECEAVLRGGGGALTCVASTDRGGVVAGDVKGALRQWSITELQRVAFAAPNAREAKQTLTAPAVSSIASISFASQSASSLNVFSFPHPPPSHPLAALPSIPASLPFPSVSSSPLRALLCVSSSASSSSTQHLFAGSDDGLRLYSRSGAAGSWSCRCKLRDGGEDERVYCLLALSQWRLAAGMGGKRICLWNIEQLLAGTETAAAAAAASADRDEDAGVGTGGIQSDEHGGCGVQLERRISGLSRSVRCLALRQQVDLT